ncbi:MAG: FtsX-like permease family protein [Massiliimalia sp.]|jgi:putative ABC transport system permease protein
MRKGFYRTLAWTGIKKNKKLYFPYIMTCIGVVMMCYIVSFLGDNPMFGSIPGGATMQEFLKMGFGVMSVFSLIFLFYTNSFLIRRRKKEFGLYNILGLGKKNLAVVLLLETLIIAAISIVGGLFFGILFSKLAELGMVRLLGADANFVFSVRFSSIGQTVVLFTCIFAVLFLNILRQIHLTNPIELLRSENAGEKPPKANWIIAILGAVILATAYYLAVSIEDPVSALMWFFVAVVMVIIGTYLLFIAGSVTLCRILQKNKRYYYKTNHFVSVSSMVYRMKRNGAGLASICILCTMVLVMVSSTVCLYLGAEDNLRNRYPRNINVDVTASSIQQLNGTEAEQTEQLIQQIVSQNRVQPENVLNYRSASFGGMIKGNQLVFDYSVYENRADNLSDIWQVFIVPLEDYNRLMGTQETLNPGEVIIYTTKETAYLEDTLQIGKSEPLTVKKRAENFVDNGIDSMQIFPTMYLFVPDFEQIVSPLIQDMMEEFEQNMLYLHWYYGFDLDCDDETQIAIQNELTTQMAEMEKQWGGNSFFHGMIEGVAKERADFYGLYGGLFFLGILLGLVFIAAAVLIIYYKQVSEGYEDQSRFEIMQKVGMTKKEIKKSINSQILTVFFLPLLTAGVHLAFAFPIVYRLLMLLGLGDKMLLAVITLCCYLVFAFFYVLVYRLTSKAYYSIVSGAQEKRA